MKDFYCLIGNPLGHSFSKKFFSEKFATENIDAEYELCPLEKIDDVEALIEAHPNLRGFNVTIPYKQQIMPYLDSLDAEAAEAGAVNVVRVRVVDGKRVLTGHNSDVYGFYNSIKPFVNPQVHKKALVLGTGGASKAVVAMLKRLGIEHLYVSRTAKDSQITYAQVTPEIMSEYKVIVNCSPVGMHPNLDDCPALPYECFTPEHIAFDLVYNPLETKFLRLAKEQGAVVKNGLEMLHLQAIRAWDIWNEK